jgi:hypothetical protein
VAEIDTLSLWNETRRIIALSSTMNDG